LISKYDIARDFKDMCLACKGKQINIKLLRTILIVITYDTIEERFHVKKSSDG